MKIESFIHETSIVNKECIIGKGTKIWHFCHLMGQSSIGQNCNIGQNVFIAENVKIGNNVKIQNNVSIYSGVICEDDVFLGPSMVFTNVKNPRSEVLRKNEYLKTIVRKGTTIGANATIVCGLELGIYSFIGAGSVVTKDVSNFSLMVGVPAKRIGWMSRYGGRLVFANNGIAYCPFTNEEYILNNGEVEVKGI